MGFITDERLSREAKLYGVAGAPPRVWPSGVLASTAGAIAIGLATPWSNVQLCAYLE